MYRKKYYMNKIKSEYVQINLPGTTNYRVMKQRTTTYHTARQKHHITQIKRVTHHIYNQKSFTSIYRITREKATWSAANRKQRSATYVNSKNINSTMYLYI